MSTTQQEFISPNGLFVKTYTTECSNKPVVAVVICTGIHQHTLLYVNFANRLVSEGFCVLCYDHRGFGQSPNYEGSDRSMIPEWHALDKPSVTGDLREMVILAKIQFNADKVFVFGHSLGGLAAVLLATCGENVADGFILSNPSVQNPWLSIVDQLGNQDPNECNGGYVDEVLRSGSNNEEYINFWMSPEISQFCETGRPFKAGYQLAANYAINEVRSRLDKFTSPVLILRGENDAFEQGACEDLVRGSSTPRDECILLSYPGMKHEILFELGLRMNKGDNKVVDDILEWLQQQRMR
jgi:alpha-beta hydrolase superfamily lysophospholipase